MTFIFNPLGPPFDITGTTGQSGPVDTLSGNDGVLVNPSSNNISIVGNGLASSGASTAGNIYVTGSGSVLTINETQAQFLTNYRQTAVSSAVTPTDYAIGCTVAGITITLPAAPTPLRILIIKDESGNAMANNIIINGNGKNINGSATYSLDTAYESANLYYNGTNWFSY
jgi:hypothetical protein